MHASASSTSTFPLPRRQVSYTSCLDTDHFQSNMKDIFSKFFQYFSLSVRTQSGSKNHTMYLNSAGVSEMGHQKADSPRVDCTLASAGRKCCQREEAWSASHQKRKQTARSKSCLSPPAFPPLTTPNGKDDQNHCKSRRVVGRAPSPASQSQILKSRFGPKRQEFNRWQNHHIV